MDATSSPNSPTTLFESGMRRLALQSEALSRGMLTRCSPLPTLPMGATSSPDPPTTPFESGVRKLVLQSEILLRGTRAPCNSFLTLRMDSTLFLGLIIKLLLYWTHFQLCPSALPLVAQSTLVFVQSPTWMVGSGTQRVAYYTGYPVTFVQACIHPPF